MNTTVASRPRACALILLTLALTGCGGGGGDDDEGGSTTPPPPPPTAQGIFKDSNVAGLSYASGGQTGVTSAGGGFTYEIGQPITFRVGNVTLGSIGSAGAKDLVTPIDLVAGGTSGVVEVQNRVRFLMMLDTDGDPLNGITIADSVRTRAQQWTQVDFATADLPGALATIIADVRSATGGAHVLPDTDAARNHLTATFRCAFSGGFRGTYAGDDRGRFGMLVGTNGAVFGIGYSTDDQTGFTTGPNSFPVSVDQQRNFIAGTTTTGASFTGRFTTPNDVSGTWRLGATEDGTFTGARVGGLANALYRFTGGYVENGGGDAGLFTFDVSATDQVAGFAYSIPGDELIALTGSVNGTTLSGTTSTGMSFTATLNKTTGLITAGTYTGAGVTGVFSGGGCRLN